MKTLRQVAILLLTVPWSATVLAKADQAVIAAVQACKPEAYDLEQQIVQIDSGTNDVEGVNAVGERLRTALTDAGAKVEVVPSSTPGLAANIVATVEGRGRGRVLLIAHMDTVFPHGTVATRHYTVRDSHGIGPGAGDDKQGDVAAVCALRVLRDLHFHDFAKVTVLLNSNEETGSFGTRDLIRRLAQESDAAINLERGVPPDGVVVARKGSATISIEVTGRAAHSGLEPEKGRNAVLEAAHQALQLGALANKDLETTVNVTRIEGGNAVNVIPEHAVVKADVRAYTTAEMDRVELALKKLATATIVPDIQVTATLTRNFPPWPRAPATDALLARARTLYSEIGGTLESTSVGSSADVAFAAETGIPAIDGLGLLGSGAHGPDDQVDLSTFGNREYLLVRLLMDLGRNPPRSSPAHRE